MRCGEKRLPPPRSVVTDGSDHDLRRDSLAHDAQNDDSIVLDDVAVAHRTITMDRPKPWHVVPILLAKVQDERVTRADGSIPEVSVSIDVQRAVAAMPDGTVGGLEFGGETDADRG